MRVPAALLAVIVSVPVIGAGPAVTGDRTASGNNPAAHCPRTRSYLADQDGLYRGPPLVPRKLTELPPATTYMAVYRRVDGCEAPMTMVEYRSPRGR